MPKIPTPGAHIQAAMLIDTKPTRRDTMFHSNALRSVAEYINSQGLPLLAVHNTSSFPIGMWFTAEVKSVEGTDDERLYTKFYMPKEIPEYEDIKSRIDTGILDSVSISFKADKHTCSICHNSIYDYENCKHFPGRSYAVGIDDQGNEKYEVCYDILDKVRPSEASLVYNGAVPAAKLVDKYADTPEGKQEYCDACQVEDRDSYVEVVPSCLLSQDYSEKQPQGEENMPKPGEPGEKPEGTIDYQAKYMDERLALIDLKEQYAEAKGQISSLKVDATYKDKYTDLVAKLGEKVTAMAAPFKQDYEVPTDPEKLFDDLAKYIDETKKLPSGQQTENEPEAPTEYQVDSAAYEV